VNAQHPVFPLAVCRLYALLLGAILSVIGIGATFAAPAPQITSFQAAPIDELAPGTELNFRVEGTPRSQVGVRIMGIGQSIPLKETSYGVYEGNYTIKRSDRPAANPAVRAMLRQQNVAVTSRLQTPLVGASAIAEPSATIQRFAMEPGAIEPGAELNFSLQGTPNGRVSVTIDRIARRVPLTEVQPGLYEGTYTVRRQDRFTAADVSASLRAGDQTARMRLPAPAPTSAHVQGMSPRAGERVSGQPMTISGSLASNVDPRSVRILLSNVDVTRDATVTTSGFTYRPESLTPGNYRVEVITSDYSGASSRTGWNFSVLPTAVAFPASIEFISPGHNAEIGTGLIEVRGRAAPNAIYNVRVNIAGRLLGMVGFNRNVLERIVETDSRGYFAFTFDPRDDLPPGTRYEVTVDGVVAGQHRQNKLTLVRR
jgi:hypothetical protein